jgi:hypothetical protein
LFCIFRDKIINAVIGNKIVIEKDIGDLGMSIVLLAHNSSSTIFINISFLEMEWHSKALGNVDRATSIRIR